MVGGAAQEIGHAHSLAQVGRCMVKGRVIHPCRPTLYIHRRSAMKAFLSLASTSTLSGLPQFLVQQYLPVMPCCTFCPISWRALSG